MKVFYISPIGATSPLLFETFTATLVASGHEVVSDYLLADTFFFDLHSGYLPYDIGVLDHIIEGGYNLVVFDAHDYHGDSTKNWYFNEHLIRGYLHNDWAKFIWECIGEKIPIVYFMRKLQYDHNFPEWVYPLELIQFPDHDFPLTTKEELSSRPYDACFIGAESPRRKAFIEALQLDKSLKLDIQFTTERIPHDEWLNRHRRAKFFIEADGGGLGSERPYQLMPIAAMIKQRNSQLINNDWEDMGSCVKMFGGGVEGSKLNVILREPNLLYHIYMNGNQRLKQYFNAEYRTKYILNILNENNIQ